MGNGQSGGATRPREVTGRTVLICFIGFFAVVFIANAVMVRMATSTFGGVETESSYKAGLAFKHEIESARAQETRQWAVQATLMRKAEDDVMVEAVVREPSGRAPQRLVATARLAHPADSRRDHELTLAEDAAGVFRGRSDIAAGHWDLVIDFSRDGERVFRSKSRVIVR